MEHIEQFQDEQQASPAHSADEVAAELQENQSRHMPEQQCQITCKEEANKTSAVDDQSMTMLMHQSSATGEMNQINLVETEEAEPASTTQDTGSSHVAPPMKVFCGQRKTKSAGIVCQHSNTVEFEVQLKEFEDCICTAENPQLRSPLRQSSKKLKVQKMKEIKKLVLEAGLTQNEESRNVVFRHCSKCGSAVFKNYVGVKPEGIQKMSPNKVPPMLMLSSMFTDQAEFEHARVNGQPALEQVAPSELLEHRVALLYMNRRDELVSNLYRLGRKFKQRTRSIHIAATLMDNFFLNKRAQTGIRHLDVLSGRCFYVFCTTFFLIASKFDEIDDRLVFIKDVQDYYRSININRNSRDEDLIPHWNDIVECERFVMNFFDWNINFTLLSPLMYLEAFLAFGTLILKQQHADGTRDKDIMQLCRDLEQQSYSTLDFLLEKRVAMANVLGPCRGHQVAAMALHKARKNLIENKRQGDILGEVWPLEIRIITRMSTSEIELVSTTMQATQSMVNELLASERGRQLVHEAEAPRVIRGQGPRAQRSTSRSAEIAAALQAAKAGPFRKKKVMPSSTQSASVPNLHAQLPEIRKATTCIPSQVITEQDEICETQVTEIGMEKQSSTQNSADRRAEINKALQAARSVNAFRIKKSKQKTTLQQSQSTILPAPLTAEAGQSVDEVPPMETVDIVRPPTQQLQLPGLRHVPAATPYQSQGQAPASARYAVGENCYSTLQASLPKMNAFLQRTRDQREAEQKALSPNDALKTQSTVGVPTQGIRKPSIAQSTSEAAELIAQVKSARTKPSDEASHGSKNITSNALKDAKERSSSRMLAAAQHITTQKARALLQKQSSTQHLRTGLGAPKESLARDFKRGVRSLSKMPDQLPDMKVVNAGPQRVVSSRKQSTGLLLNQHQKQRPLKESLAALKLFKLNLTSSQNDQEREDSQSDRELSNSINKCLKLESIMKQRPSQDWIGEASQKSARKQNPANDAQPNKLKSRVFSMDIIDYKSSGLASNRNKKEAVISTESIMLKDVCSKLRIHASDEKDVRGKDDAQVPIGPPASGSETARTGSYRKDVIDLDALHVQRDSSSKQSTQNTSVRPDQAAQKKSSKRQQTSQVSDVPALEQLHAILSGSVDENSYQASSDEKVKSQQQHASGKKITFMNRATRHERLLRGASKIDLSQGETAGLSSDAPRLQQFHTTRGSEALDAARQSQLKSISLLAQQTEGKPTFLAGKKSHSKLMSQEACRIQSSSLMRGSARLSLQGRTGLLNLNGLQMAKQQREPSSSGKSGVPHIWRKAAPPATLSKHLPEAFRTQREKTFMNDVSQHASASTVNLMSNTARQNMLRLKRRGRGVEASSSQAKMECGRSTTARNTLHTQAALNLAPQKTEGLSNVRSQNRRLHQMPDPQEQYMGSAKVDEGQKGSANTLCQSKSFARLTNSNEAQYFACGRQSRKDLSRLRTCKLASIDCNTQVAKPAHRHQLSLLKESKSLSAMHTLNTSGVNAKQSNLTQNRQNQQSQSHLQAVVAKQRKQRPFTYKMEDQEHVELLKVLSQLSPASTGKQAQEADKALA